MKHIKTFSLFESKNSLTKVQVEFLNRYVKGTWKYNPETGLVDVDGAFIYTRTEGTTLRGVQFGHVSGNFNCNGNHLTSLEGAPRIVDGDFVCSLNKLTSLKGAPETVKGDFFCFRNELISLRGAPQTIGGDFNCSNNNLTSLEGGPQTVGGDFDCVRNRLTSLESGPKTVKGKFRCDTFELGQGEWNPEGRLKAAQVNNQAAKLLVQLLSGSQLDSWMTENPLDLDLLDDFPEIKAGVLKRTGLRDISKLSASLRQKLL